MYITKRYYDRLRSIVAAGDELAQALNLVKENFNRDLASGNFLGDDDHEMMRVVSKALEAYERVRGEK